MAAILSRPQCVKNDKHSWSTHWPFEDVGVSSNVRKFQNRFMAWCLMKLPPSLQDRTDDKSTLVQLMVVSCQATNHYLQQCLPNSMTPFGWPGGSELMGAPQIKDTFWQFLIKSEGCNSNMFPAKNNIFPHCVATSTTTPYMWSLFHLPNHHGTWSMMTEWRGLIGGRSICSRDGL